MIKGTDSTASRTTMEKLKTVFTTHGTPRQLESDKDSPFNSKEFEQFAKTEGLYHVTPDCTTLYHATQNMCAPVGKRIVL